ncbi:hypothetical protein WR164_00510 [Philodulcilactobacillus myokoensis]|uniref:THIF-type NAD/FAD binding fold domain-containing protein n=2 Tax=Philodulcilactobacillus myokoensis TaxID=2929573 RepID=A0A9W6ERY3_9LACO|nr:hypothetical protein WR164_00510 [Philodulcilactobacillus myokoensis]
MYPVNSTVDNKHIRLSNFIDCFPSYTYPEYKNKINNIKILLLGLGTAGSYILEVLTKLGFHNFILIDGDRIEEKNIMAQNYNLSDVGKLKTSVIKSKFPNINVKVINEKISSYDNLKQKIDLSKIDFFINCADDFKLQMDILNNIFNEYPKTKIIYGGYSFLMHSDDFITKSNYKVFQKIALKQSANINIDNYVIENSGSILNGFMSALVISTYVFNYVVKNRYKDQFLGDFYRNKFKFFNQNEKF